MGHVIDDEEESKPLCDEVSIEDQHDESELHDLPGFKATVAQSEAAWQSGCLTKEDGSPPYMEAAYFWGDHIDDKILASMRVYQAEGVGSIRSCFEAGDTTSGDDYYVCPFFTTVGDTTDPRTGQECLAVQFRDRFKRARDLLIPRSLIAEGQSKLAAYLASNGFDIPTGKKLRERVQLLLHSLHGPRVEIATRAGWHNGSVFILPNRFIGATSGTRILTDLPSNLKFAQRGLFKGWRRGVGEACKGNSRLQLAVSAAFASALLRFAPSITPTVVHIFGETSTGKSTALIAAGSVWGGAEDDALGYAESWNATMNAHLAKAAARSGTLYALDEMRTGENIAKSAYALSSGQDRGRLDKSANLRSASKFGVFTLSTGEVTLDEMERLSNPRSQAYGGAEIRLPSIPADAGAGLGLFEDVHGYDKAKNASNGGAGFAEHVQTEARENYGWAGPRFVECLIEHLDGIDDGGVDFGTQLNTTIDRFVTNLNLEPGADDAVRRLARTFGLIAAAGQLASDFDIVPVTAEEMVAGVRKCFNDWLTSRGGVRSKTTTTALIALRDYIGKNMGRFVATTEAATTTAPTIAGYKDRDTFYVLPPTWREVLQSAPRAKLIEELDRLGLLKRQAQKGDQVVKKLPGGSAVRAYAVSGRILSIGDDGKLPDVDAVDAGDDDKIVVSIESARRLKSTIRQPARQSLH